jgi:hypothetical protein
MKLLMRLKREMSEDLERRIRAARIPIAPKIEKGEEPELLIRQDSDAYESTVFDATGGAGLILPLKIVPNIPVFVLSGFDIFLERWPNAWFRLLEQNGGDNWPHYNFHGRQELKFDRSQTMNHAVEGRKEFRRGHVVRGLLLGLSFNPIPDDICRGEILRGSIKILDQFEHAHSAPISLRVDREAERAFKPTRRRRLFDRPDFRADSQGTAEGEH